MNNLPGVAIVSCSQTRPKSLIKLISKTQEIEENCNNPGIIRHYWNLDTKYYTAQVNLLGIETTEVSKDEELINSIEALIIHMDSNSKNGLEDLNKWKFLDVWNVDVKLLLSNYCTDNTNITKSQALEWCLKMGFEFIELYPTIQKSDQDDDIVPEKYGVDRVVEALQAHTWSNLVMKDRKKSKPVISSNLTKEKVEGNEAMIPNDNLDDFTELFSQLQSMKDSLQGMPVNQRKQCAEQMVTAFWKAIGGEEEEILDL